MATTSLREAGQDRSNDVQRSEKTVADPVAGNRPRSYGGGPPEDRSVHRASGEVEKRAELPPHGRLLHADIAGELVLVEHSPNRREESRELERERGVVAGGGGQHPQLLADEIVERVLHSEAALDRPSGAALLDPDLLEVHDGRNIPAWSASCNASRRAVAKIAAVA